MKNGGWNIKVPALGFAAFVALPPGIRAQEAIQGAELVEVNRRARTEAINRNLYNLRAGPVLMRFEGALGFEINSNPHLLEDPDKVDFAFRPELNVATMWPINQYNGLSLDLGLAYLKYIHNTELDQLVISPNSELSLDIRAGDFTINLHERLSYTQDPVTDPTVSGTGEFGGIENTVGLRVDWDLNQLQLSIGYDHFNFISTGSGLSDVQERSSELFYTRGAVKVSQSIETGLEMGGGLTDYDQDVFSDGSHFSVGPFVQLQLSRDLQLKASGGYVRYDFDQTGITSTPSSVGDFYADVSADHQLSQYMSHRLSMGREAGAGASAELVTLYYVRYENKWDISQYSVLRTRLFYENGRERGGFTSEKLWRVGAGASVGVPLSRQLTASVGYDLLYKDSDQPMRDYTQHLATIEFRYQF